MLAFPSINGHDIVVFGASAGGIEALKRAIAQLPTDLMAAIIGPIRNEIE